MRKLLWFPFALLTLTCGSAMASGAPQSSDATDQPRFVTIPTLPGKWIPEQVYDMPTMAKCLTTLAGVADMAEKDRETENIHVLARDRDGNISDYFIRVRGKDHVVSCIPGDDHQVMLMTLGLLDADR